MLANWWPVASALVVGGIICGIVPLVMVASGRPDRVWHWESDGAVREGYMAADR